MSDSSTPRPLHTILRFVLLVSALILMGLMFFIMRTLFLPSQYLQAYKTAEAGPRHAADLKKLSILNFNAVLYLSGPVTPASGSKKEGTMFPMGAKPLLVPCTFSDATGAVEILAEGSPESTESLSNYFFGQPVHMLGWRTSESGYSLFMIGKSRDDLLSLLLRRSENWKLTLFLQGALLLALIFFIFWFLNMAVLSNVRIHNVQVLSVNLIFLILLYSALFLSGYPLLSTLPLVLLILLLGNLVFVPLAWLLKPRRPKTAA
jgi:hypothetical protein